MVFEKLIQGIKDTGAFVVKQAEKAYQGIEDTGAFAVKQLKKAGKAINDTYNYLGRKVERLTNKHLCRPARDVVQQACWGLPYTAALTPFAVVGLGVVAAGVAFAALRIFENQVEPQARQRMYQGIRNFCAVGAAIDTARSIALLNPVFIINLPFYLLIGYLADENAKHAYATRP